FIHGVAPSQTPTSLPYTTLFRSAMPSMTMVQAIQDALRLALREDPRVVVLGEDVGVNGGVFRVTEGLQAEFGAERVADTPLAEKDRKRTRRTSSNSQISYDVLCL